MLHSCLNCTICNLLETGPPHLLLLQHDPDRLKVVERDVLSNALLGRAQPLHLLLDRFLVVMATNYNGRPRSTDLDRRQQLLITLDDSVQTTSLFLVFLLGHDSCKSFHRTTQPLGIFTMVINATNDCLQINEIQ